MLRSYLNFIFRHRIGLALAFIFLFIFCVFQAKNLKLKSDFKELLPETFQSVIDLNKIVERIGGNGSLIVAIESHNPEASIRFGEDLVAQLKTYPPELIHRIEYNAESAKKFFMDHKYLYMDLEDIQAIHDRLERRIGKEKLKKSGVYLEFETDEESKRADNFEDIKEKYTSKTSAYEHYLKGYFFDQSQQLMAIVIRPPGSAIGIEFSKQLISKVEKTIQDLNPQKYDPSLNVKLTGHFKRVLFEYQTLYNDIVSTAGLCVLLVGLAVFFYYRRLRMVMLMAWATFNGTIWAFAITAWKIGYLTTQTAFLGSIIIGNGINHGLILMARYLEERKLGKTPLESLHISIPATLTGTLTSSVTTTLSFGVLMMSDMRGFSQFGFIGGLGMFFCWVSTYTVLPIFLILTEEILPVVKNNPSKGAQFSFIEKLADLIPHYSKHIVVTGFALTLLSIPMMIYFYPNALEYDLNKLRVKMKGQDFIEDTQLNERVKKIFGGAVTPTVLVTDHAEETLPLCREIMRKNDLDPPDKRVIESCKSLYSYIPEDQDAKIEWLGKIRKLIEKNTFDSLTPEQKKNLNEFKEQFRQEEHVTFADLPETLVANFREKNGDVGKLVYIYTNDKLPLWNGKNLIHFADLIRQNRLPSGEVVTSSGDSAIFADIFRAVAHDGPRLTALAFLSVCLAVLILFRERKGFFYIVGTLVIGIFLMGGVIALCNFKINFFNFIAIPTTFGIGVDYGCNVYQRYRLEGKGSLVHVIKTTGGAVLLCSLTTIIGYFTLVIAKNQALVSFGWIAIIGEATCILSALALVPALVMRLENKSFEKV